MKVLAASGLIFLVLGGLVGCGPSGPVGDAVNGKIVFKGKPGSLDRLAGGKVWAQSTSDPDRVGMGFIGEDGTFSLETFLKKEQKGHLGLMPGTYRAH